MKIIAFETATPASSVAIGEDGLLSGMSVNLDRRGHVGFLVPALDLVLSRAGWEPRDIDIVTVDIGPGPFTGLRAGIATAQAMAAMSRRGAADRIHGSWHPGSGSASVRTAAARLSCWSRKAASRAGVSSTAGSKMAGSPARVQP